MRQEFNPLWFIPSSTYLSKFFSVIENYYPDNGQMATIYVKTDHLSKHLTHLDELISTLRNETEIISRVDDWFTGFKEFSSKHHSIGKVSGVETSFFKKRFIIYCYKPNCFRLGET